MTKLSVFLLFIIVAVVSSSPIPEADHEGYSHNKGKLEIADADAGSKSDVGVKHGVAVASSDSHAKASSVTLDVNREEKFKGYKPYKNQDKSLKEHVADLVHDIKSKF